MILTSYPFDYLSIIFVLLLIIPMLSGFAQGGYRTLIRLIVTALCFLLAVLVYQNIARAYLSSSNGQFMQRNFIDALGKIAFTAETPLGGTAEFKLSDPLPRAYFESEEFRQALYDAIHLASPLRPGIDKWLLSALPESMTTQVYLHELLGITLFDLIVKGVSFGIVFGITSLACAIITGIISIFLRKRKRHRSTLNRILGVLFGLVSGISFCWTLGFVLNIGLAVDSPLRATLASVLRYDDPEITTFAKWIVTGPFGYNEILENFAMILNQI